MQYNTSVHSATRFTPYEVIYGRKARNPTKIANDFPVQTYESYVCDLVRNLINIKNVARENIISAKHRSKEYYDRKARPQHLEVGMVVYVFKEPRKRKLHRFFNGKFIVREVRDNKNVVEAENGKKIAGACEN